MKKLLVLTCIILCSLSLFAQHPQKPSKGQEYIQKQIKHYADTFALDEAKTTTFAELYKGYNKELREIQQTYRPKKKMNRQAIHSEEEIEKRILDNFTKSRAILDIREKYYKSFRTILSPSQVQTIYKDEKARMNKMRKHMMKNKKNNCPKQKTKQ